MRWTQFALAVLLCATTAACRGTGSPIAKGGPGTDSAPPAAVPEAGKGPSATPDQAAPDGTLAADAAGADAATGADATAGTPEATVGTPAPTPNETQIAVAKDFVFPRRGPKDAKLVIYEFADFRCPFCRQFAEETLPLLQKDFMGKDGQVAIEFVDFPIADHGIPAVVSSEAAHCANEVGKYWEMHDAIYGDFANMNDLPLEDEAAAIDHLVGLASGIGIDSAHMRECLETERYRPVLATLYKDARDAHIEVTPTLIVGNEVVLGFKPYAEFKPIVERELSIALGTPAPTDTPGTPPAETATPAASGPKP